MRKALALFAFLLVACGSSSQPATPNPDAGSPADAQPADAALDAALPPVDFTPSDLPKDLLDSLALPDVKESKVTYKSDVIVLDEKTIKTSLEGAFSADGWYHFKPGKIDATKLEVGKTLVIPYVGVFKINDVQEDDMGVHVATGDAALDDAIQDGTLTWDVAVPKAAVDLDGAGPPTTKDFRGTIDGFDVVYKAQPTGDGTRYRFELGGGEKTGDTNVAFSKVSYVARFRAYGNARFASGRLVSAQFGVRDLFVELTAKAGVVSKAFKKKFDMPPFLVIPFNVGLIPLFVTVGTNVEMETTTNIDSSVIGQAKLTFRGNGSYELKPDGMSTAMGNVQQFDVTFQGGSYVTTYEVGAGVFVDVPKIVFGVGLPRLADTAPAWLRPELDRMWASVGLPGAALLRETTVAGLHLKLIAEVVQNVKVKIDTAGPTPVVKATCATVTFGAAAMYGGEGTFFASRLSSLLHLDAFIEDKQLGGKTKSPHRYGPGCSQFPAE